MYHETQQILVLQHEKAAGKNKENAKKKKFPRGICGKGGLGWSNKREHYMVLLLSDTDPTAPTDLIEITRPDISFSKRTCWTG